MAEVLAPETAGYFCHSPLRRSPPPPLDFPLGSPNSFASDLRQKYSASQQLESISTSSSAPASLHSSHVDLQGASFLSTPNTSFSLDTSESEEEISLPSYGDESSSSDLGEIDIPISPKTQSLYSVSSTEKNTTPANTPENAFFISEDDTAVRPQPTQHVDYLSHDWKEEDIWSSWRHIVSKRKVYGAQSRLENASWRTWTKQKYKLRTISPETLNWLKDCDVTWLYGPLQTARHKSEPTSALSKNNSFLNKKPILKKRSMSEVMLQKSISTSSLVAQAAASVRAQENMQGSGHLRRPILGSRAHSDSVTPVRLSATISRDDTSTASSHSTSGLRTPADKRHIRFDEKVEQCIAVDAKDEGDEEEMDWHAVKEDDEESSDDGVVMMKSDRKRPMSRSNSRSSFSGDSKTIAKLPSTKLKYRTDSPDLPDHPSHSVNTHIWRSPRISPSASQETLRPSNPSKNFLLHDEDEDEDEMSWEPSGAFSNRVDSLEQLDRQYTRVDREPSEGTTGGMRRTESGMFMPWADDDEEPVSTGVFGRVVDGYNTARDIAHVLWNVGWSRGNSI